MKRIILIGLMVLLSGCGTTIQGVVEPTLHDIKEAQDYYRETLEEAVDEAHDQLVSTNEQLS
jgi:hypothetical protein